jgi:hypothetical protein
MKKLLHKASKMCTGILRDFVARARDDAKSCLRCLFLPSQNYPQTRTANAFLMSIVCRWHKFTFTRGILSYLRLFRAVKTIFVHRIFNQLSNDFCSTPSDRELWQIRALQEAEVEKCINYMKLHNCSSVGMKRR